VGLSEDVRQRIDALVGLRRRAQFIREAVEAELRRREQRIAVGSANAEPGANPIAPRAKHVQRKT
jgi:predicted transcriptional regulator